MCVIVDTNTFGPVFNDKDAKHADFEPILHWVLYGKGKFVIGGSKYMGELKKAKRYLHLFGILNSYKDKIIKLDDQLVDNEQKRLETMVTDPDFDDPHLPAMVIVSKCQIICSDDTRSIRFVTDPRLYPDGVKTPKYYTGIRNRNLLCDKYVDDKYKPLNKLSLNKAETVEGKIKSMLDKGQNNKNS